MRAATASSALLRSLSGQRRVGGQGPPARQGVLVRHSNGIPADVYHVEVQVQRTEDFQERMVAYWAALALKYRRADGQQLAERVQRTDST
jgi:hypothetical protein